MTAFKDLGIKPDLSNFIGDKINIDRIINTEIKVHFFKIEDSKKKEGTKFLTMQIEKNETKHIVFTGSTILMNMIKKVPADKFPFTTTIIKESQHLEFT